MQQCPLSPLLCSLVLVVIASAIRQGKKKSYTGRKDRNCHYFKKQNLNTERINNPINKWTNEFNIQFSKEVQMANK
jgi:hypothetical protein